MRTDSNIFIPNSNPLSMQTSSLSNIGIQTVSPNTLFDIDYPILGNDNAVCIGIKIDWQHKQGLRDFALHCTHAEEHAKAARFRREEDALRHLLGRALLRALAIHYGGMPPGRIIPTNAWGKPEPLAPPFGCNLSHSGDHVWAVVARSPLAGIDIESDAAPDDYLGMLRTFHPLEIHSVSTAPDAALAMMRCWSRKEAIAKASGQGLSLPLDSYAVDCSDTTGNWLQVAPPVSSPGRWLTTDLPLDSGYVGALAIYGQCRNVTVLKLHFSNQ